MSDQPRETAFLKPSIGFDDFDERGKLEERIAQVQRDERCVQRAAFLMALLAALCAAGLGYGVVLQKDFPRGESQFVINLICEIGLASLICLVAFAGLLMSYQKKLIRLQEECRRLVTKLLEFHLGKPPVTPSRDSHSGASRQRAVEVTSSSDRLDSLPQA